MGSESEDDGFESVISAVTTEKPTKAKRKLTAAQLEQLALAREKANAVRKRNAQQRKVQKQKEQKLKDFQHQREQDELDKQLSQFSAPRTAPRKAPTPVAEEESSESSESEEETPPPVKAVKAKSQKSKKKKKKQRPVSESSESSEEEYVPPKKTRVKHQHQHQQQQEDLYDHQMRRAFASLFPNSFV
jgi:hypothetical protein